MSEDATTSVELPPPPHAPVREEDRRRIRTEQHHHGPVSLRLHTRVRHGALRSHNWFQLLRFGAVGASGYVVNLAVFALCLHLLGIDYRISAVLAWVVSVLNNFWLNRHWTFRAKEAHPVGQAVRFFAVSLVTFGFTYLVLIGLVSGIGLTKVLAQAIAVAAGTPLNFVGQKLWSFRI